MTDHRQKAKQLMVHYFELVWQKADLFWDDDNRVELEMLVDHLVDAAKAEAAQAETPIQYCELCDDIYDTEGTLCPECHMAIHEDPPAWALGQDPDRCDRCGTLLEVRGPQEPFCPTCNPRGARQPDPAGNNPFIRGQADHFLARRLQSVLASQTNLKEPQWIVYSNA